MIQELRLDPVELSQYFGESVGELEGTALSTGSGGTGHYIFLCDVTHANIILISQRSIIRFSPAFRHRSEYIIIALLLFEYSPPLCMDSLTSIGLKTMRIVRLVNSLLVCKDLDC